MKLTWLGHSAFRVEAAGKVLLIDPFLTGNPSFTGTVDDVASGVTHVLITHGHDDHIGDAADIAIKTKAQVVSNYEICLHLQSKGVENINPGNTGGEVDCGGFKVAFTQALHSSAASGPNGALYMGNPNGLIVIAPGEPTLYHMGDTDLFGDMALIEEFYSPRIGIVPIGDRFTMGGTRAAWGVKKYFAFSDVFPCHYGTFPIIDATPETFVKGLAGSSAKVHTPKPGESVSVVA